METIPVIRRCITPALCIISFAHCAGSPPFERLYAHNLRPPPARESGFLVGQVGDSSQVFRFSPSFVIQRAQGLKWKRSPHQVTWYDDGMFSIELPVGEYILNDVVMASVADSANATYFTLPVNIRFAIKGRTASNLGRVTTLPLGSQKRVRIHDNSDSAGARFLGPAAHNRVIPLVFGVSIPQPDSLLFDRTIPPNPLDMRELLIIRRLSAPVSPPGYEPSFPLCWRLPEYCYGDDDGYVPRFNWQDANGYQTFYKLPLVAPWIAGNNIGVNVTNYLHPTSHGWRLYTKRMTCADYGIECTPAGGGVNDGPMPYFALYNVHTGMLRTFVYINKDNYTANQELVANVGVSQEGPYTPNLDYGTDLFANALARSISQNSEDAEPIVYLTPALFHKWVVIDQELAYSPDKTIGDGLLLSINFDGVSQSEISVTGDLRLTKTEVLSDDKGALQTVWNKRDKVADAFNTPSEWSTSASKKAKKLANSKDPWKKGVGNDLINASKAVSPFVPYLGAALAGYEIFSAFSASSSGAVRSELFEGAISLGGTLKHQHPIDVIKFGVHQSKHADPVNESELDFSGRIGVWGLKELPSIDLYLDGLRMQPFPLQDFILVNPASSMGLVKATASVSFEFNHYVGCPNKVSKRFPSLVKPLLQEKNDDSLTGNENRFWRRVCNNTEVKSISSQFVRQYPSGEVTFEVVDDGNVQSNPASEDPLYPIDVPALHTYISLSNPAARIRAMTVSSESPEAQVNWRPMIYWLETDDFNGYTWNHAMNRSHIPTLKAASMKVYLKFNHYVDPTIYYEVIKTFPVTINRHACTLRSYNTPNHDKRPPPRCDRL